MRRFTLLAINICFVSLFFNLNAQEEETKPVKKFKMNEPFSERISLTAQAGWLHSWGDFKKDGVMPSFLQADANEMGFAGYLNYDFSRILTFSAGMLIGELEGSFDDLNTQNARNSSVDYGRGVFYQTDILEFTLPKVTLNVSRLIFKNNSSFFNKASLNAFASHGLVRYNSKIYPQSGPEVNLLYSKTRGRTGSTTEAVTSVGGSFSYILNDKFDINLESSLRHVYNDKLDAWVGGDHNDKYSYTAIGVTYYIKKRRYVNRKFDLQEDEMLANEVENTEEANEEEMEDAEETVEDEVVETEDTMTDPVETNNTVDEMEEEVEDNTEDTETMDDETETEQGDNVVTDDTPKYTPPTLEDGSGYYVTVAAFRSMVSSRRMVQILEDKGEKNPTIIRNRNDTWYLITIANYGDKKTALKAMKEARRNGYDRAWVHIKPEE